MQTGNVTSTEESCTGFNISLMFGGFKRYFLKGSIFISVNTASSTYVEIANKQYIISRRVPDLEIHSPQVVLSWGTFSNLVKDERSQEHKGSG